MSVDRFSLPQERGKGALAIRDETSQGSIPVIRVRIVSRENGRPLRGARVSLHLFGLSGGVTDEQFTDEGGEARFDYAPAEGVVYVDGNAGYRGFVRGVVEVRS